MNYRHIYHAGNFADVMKHLALVLVLDYLKKKDTGFCVVDAHGGIGLYDLQSVQAGKTMEWESGIGRFTDLLENAPEDFALYAAKVLPLFERSLYPGSPLLSAESLRPQDRLIANELHPDDVEDLKDNLYDYKNARVTHSDAYECIRANIPPEEKRGLVLIDPPFEKTDEFQTLIKQMTQWKKRFANGIFMIWYPIKSHLAVDDLKQAAKDLDMKRTWCFETLAYPRNQEGTFNGSGLIIMNTPYMIPERIEALFPLLKDKMGLFAVEQSWLTAP
jgi:23S rRNA (adenine2030-N6)-methyltransferase